MKNQISINMIVKDYKIALKYSLMDYLHLFLLNKLRELKNSFILLSLTYIAISNFDFLVPISYLMLEEDI